MQNDKYKEERKKVERTKVLDALKLGRSIKLLRKLNGINQGELSVLTGISRENLSRFECGGYNMKLSTLALICSKLNANLSITFDIQLIDKKREIQDGTANDKLFGK